MCIQSKLTGGLVVYVLYFIVLAVYHIQHRPPKAVDESDESMKTPEIEEDNASRSPSVMNRYMSYIVTGKDPEIKEAKPNDDEELMGRFVSQIITGLGLESGEHTAREDEKLMNNQTFRTKEQETDKASTTDDGGLMNGLVSHVLTGEKLEIGVAIAREDEERLQRFVNHIKMGRDPKSSEDWDDLQIFLNHFFAGVAVEPPKQTKLIWLKKPFIVFIVSLRLRRGRDEQLNCITWIIAEYNFSSMLRKSFYVC